MSLYLHRTRNEARRNKIVIVCVAIVVSIVVPLILALR